MERPCLLVLNERQDPGWRARVDDRPSPLIAVDGLLMGTPLPSGEHRVEFLYQPRAFVVGRAILLAACVLAGLLLLASKAAGRGPARRVRLSKTATERTTEVPASG